MMKKFYLILSILTVLVSGCSQEEMLKNQPSLSDFSKFTASFEQNESRTYVEEGNLLRWTKGDQISLFVANTLNRQYQFDGETGDNSGTFSVVNSPFGTGNDLDCHYAVYPYLSSTKIKENGTITTTLPTEQSYALNSFGLGNNTMVAITKDIDDTFLKFKNVCGYLKLQLYGDDVTIRSITLIGNNDEKLAGTASITLDYGQEPTICMTNDATKTIILDCGKNGVKIGTDTESATAFWIVLPPTTFDNGFTIVIKDIYGDEFIQSTSNKLVVQRNVIKPMSALKVGMVSSVDIPKNQIWYTTQNNSILTPNIPYAFGANIVSNVYENGKGIITFDGDVTTIGRQAFGSCTSLTSITIPNRVTTIGTQAFIGCTSLTDITIPNSVTSMGNSAFESCTSLKSIVIPENIVEIREFTFSQCKSLSNITIPDGVTTIGEYAFWYCSSLKGITIPNSITTIENQAFNKCTSLTSVVLPNSLTTINSIFTHCTSLTDVEIPNGVTTINGAFAGCTSLTNIDIPSSVTTLNGSFQYCTSLADVTIPNNVTLIGNYTFEECAALETIMIPEGVTSIGHYAFEGCRSLSNITIPGSVTTIGNYAFSRCTLLRNLTISDGVVTIGEHAFSACQSLGKVTIPNSVTTIEANAFLSCFLLNYVTLSASCNEMTVPFAECTSLEEIHVPTATPPIIYDKDNQPDGLITYQYYAFDSSIYSRCKIYVPKGSINAYKEAYGWKNFANIIEVD